MCVRMFDTVGTCQELEKISGTTFKSSGDNFTLRCPTYLCVDGNCRFTKLNESSQELELIEEGYSFVKTITGYKDAGVYCCTPPHTNNTTKSCCTHITGMK